MDVKDKKMAVSSVMYPEVILEMLNWPWISEWCGE